MKNNKAMFNVDPDIWKQFRAKTILENKTATEVIVNFLAEYIKEPAKPKK